MTDPVLISLPCDCPRTATCFSIFFMLSSSSSSSSASFLGFRNEFGEIFWTAATWNTSNTHLRPSNTYCATHNKSRLPDTYSASPSFSSFLLSIPEQMTSLQGGFCIHSPSGCQGSLKEAHQTFLTSHAQQTLSATCCTGLLKGFMAPIMPESAPPAPPGHLEAPGHQTDSEESNKQKEANCHGMSGRRHLLKGASLSDSFSFHT